jgi:DNA (cytosine-5)-methyltransferase 3A
MSCGQIALNKAGIKYDNYFASEIDKYAIQVTKDNFPDTIHLGDVTKIDFKALPKIDLLIGGSPCQGFSFAGKQLNFNDPRSALFFEYVRALKETNPKYFLLENVKMEKESEEVFTEMLGVSPIKIQSSLVSAQSRNRLYWTNILGVNDPEDKGIKLKDILEENPDSPVYLSNSTVERFLTYGVPLLTGDEDKARCLAAMEYVKNGKQGNYLVVQINPSKESGGKQPYMQNRVYHSDYKAPALTAAFASRMNILDPDFRVRKLTVIECKRLQTVPDDYKMNVSNTQAYKMLGNGWTVDVIAHIFKNILNG